MSISFDEEFEKLGEAEVRRMLLERDNADSVMLLSAPAWLSLKDSERIARSEAREEESLSNSRKALHIAKWANIWAAIATLIAAIAMYIAYVCIPP